MRRFMLALYRVRGPVYYAAIMALVASMLVLFGSSDESARAVSRFVLLAGLATAALCGVLSARVPRILSERPTCTVGSPVAGRWLGLNSPASKVPSHGIRAYGQAYAIDLVFEPEASERPGFGGEAFRASAAYPAFGEPVFAMIDGEVVAASHWRRDHRARSSWLGFVYLMIEGMLRELGGPGFVVGNHVTILGDDGVYASVAHLQQGSLAVRVGERVVAGQRIGLCGNSGNSSEPHVHAQLMDRKSFWTAHGIPMAFAGILLDDDALGQDALPANEQHMIAGELA